MNALNDMIRVKSSNYIHFRNRRSLPLRKMSANSVSIYKLMRAQ